MTAIDAIELVIGFTDVVVVLGAKEWVALQILDVRLQTQDEIDKIRWNVALVDVHFRYAIEE